MVSQDRMTEDDEGTMRGKLAHTGPHSLGAGPAVTDVSSEAQDPAEPPEGFTPLSESSLGQSPTPQIPAKPDRRSPFIASEAPTQSIPDDPPSGEPARVTASPARGETTIDAADLEPSGVAFGPRGGFVSTPSPFQVPPKSGPPVLRRAESVLEEAARVRSVGDRLRTGFGLVGRAVTVAVGESGMRIVRHFERLPRWQQVLCVATPYASALGLVAYLLFGHTPNVEVAPVGAGIVSVETDGRLDRIAPNGDAAPTSSSDGPQGPEAQATADPPNPTTATEPSLAAGGPSIAEAGPKEAAPQPFRAKVVTLPVSSTLFVRPDPTVGRSARLRAGHVVTVYPDFPSAEGWTLAQSERGTVGYISKKHLTGQRDPAYDAARKARRRRARSRRRSKPPRP